MHADSKFITCTSSYAITFFAYKNVSREIARNSRWKILISLFFFIPAASNNRGGTITRIKISRFPIYRYANFSARADVCRRHKAFMYFMQFARIRPSGASN